MSNTDFTQWRREIAQQVRDGRGGAMNDEFHALSMAQQTAVNAAIRECQRTKVRTAIGTGDGGEAYAYPHSDGTAWGFNRGSDGCNVARGVVRA